MINPFLGCADPVRKRLCARHLQLVYQCLNSSKKSRSGVNNIFLSVIVKAPSYLR